MLNSPVITCDSSMTQGLGRSENFLVFQPCDQLHQGLTGFLTSFCKVYGGDGCRGACPPNRGCKGQQPLVEPAADLLDKGGLEAARDPNLPQIKLLWVPQQCSRFIAQPDPGKQFLLSPTSPKFPPGQLRGPTPGTERCLQRSPSLLHTSSPHLSHFSPEMSCSCT